MDRIKTVELGVFQNILKLCSFCNPKLQFVVMLSEGVNRLVLLCIMLQIGSKLALLFDVLLCFSVVLVLAQYNREKLDLSIVWRKGRSRLHEIVDGYSGLQLSKNLSLTVFPPFSFSSFCILFLLFLRAQPDVTQIYTITEKQWAMLTEQPIY